MSRQLVVGLRAMLMFTVVLGLLYPLAMTGVAQALFHGNANGSIVKVDGKDVGSDLIGQAYTKQVIENGKPKVDQNGDPVMEPDPKWFQTRPSAVDYDGLGSSASQLGPNNKDLIASIDERRKAVAAFEGVDPKDVPADAVTASSSGLDPQISPAYADLQIARVAKARTLPVARVRQLVKDNTVGRSLGFLGEPGVNVLTLNLELDRVAPVAP